MTSDTYDLFGTLTDAIQEFDTKSINVVPSLSDDQGKRYLMPDDQGYQFSQRRMIADIDLAYNSIFKKGKYDSEGQRKLFLNIVRFYVNVAVKNTDIDVKNFVFAPADYSTENIWAVWFLQRQFKAWVRDSGFSKVINDLNFDFNKYGSCVLKRVKGDVVRTQLRSLKMDQSAETLMEGIEGGTPLIEEHEMSYIQAKKFKGWNLPSEKWKGKRPIYEMYTFVPKCVIDEANGDAESEDEEMVLAMAVLMPSGKLETDKRKKYEDKILFIEQVDDIPYEECHSEKQDGRWLGIGNVEKQLENQIARNRDVNLRGRSMLWSSKKLFQSQGDEVNRNLVKDVKDGTVLRVGLNGLISQVNTQTQSLADYKQDEEVWDENSKQQAFAFEVATGENTPSGMPFRLGAMLSNSVMSYFDRQKEIFGLFLKDAFFEKIIPIFQSRAKDDIVRIGTTDEGYAMIKEFMVENQTREFMYDLALSPDYFTKSIPTHDEIKQKIEQGLIKSPYLFADVPKHVYKDAKYDLELDITGEDRDPADRETLTTLYTALAQKGDPRADKVLEVLLSSMGKNLKAIAGEQPKPQPQVNQQPQGGMTVSNPDLAGLTPITTPENATAQ